MKGRNVIMMAVCVAVVWAIGLTSGPAYGQEATLRIGTVAPSGTPWSAMLKRAKKRIQEASGGRIKVKTYLGGKLGSESSLVRRCQGGKLGGIAVSNGALGQAVGELYATELPYLFNTHKEADKALDAATPLIRQLLDEKGFVFHMWGENGFRHFASKEKFFSKAADFNGMKMRAQPAMPHVEMYNALGAGASTISVGEVTSSLANGVVDGYDNTLLYAYATQWHKEVKYVTLSSHIYQAAVVVWCKPWFESLPADLQAILNQVPAGETTKGRAAVRAMNKRLQKEYKKAGVEVRTMSTSDKAALKSATAGVTQKFLSKTSARGKELYDLLKANR